MLRAQVLLATLCVVLGVVLRGFSIPSFFLPGLNTQVEHNIKQEMVAPSKHALVVGASSGIGLGVAKELAPMVAKLTLCSRSCPEELLKTIKADNPNVEVVHEKLDVSLMHEVRKFTTKHAKTQFEGVRVATWISTISTSNAPTHPDAAPKLRCSTHLMVQAFSERAPNASFLHASPGLVGTAVADNTPWYVRLPFKGLASVFARTPETCAKHMVSALLNEDYATGWKLLDPNGKTVSATNYQTDELKDVVWNHTLKTIDNILKQ